jgi:hypothetical protein
VIPLPEDGMVKPPEDVDTLSVKAVVPL